MLLVTEELSCEGESNRAIAAGSGEDWLFYLNRITLSPLRLARKERVGDRGSLEADRKWCALVGWGKEWH